MKRILTVLALAWTGCASVHVNRVALIASTAALACDWGQTRHAAANGWRGDPMDPGSFRYEDNPVMGPAPSTRTVDLYFGSMIAINTVLWLAIPRRYRLIVPGVVIGAQVATISGNLESVRGTCGM